MDIQNLMNMLGEKELGTISDKIGADKASTASAIQSAVPALLGALNNKAQSGGAGGILAALDRDHDGSILDDIGGFIQGGNIQNGAGILKHVLGDNTGNVTQAIAGQSGLSTDKTSTLLQTLAPIVMGYLGKQKQQGGVASAGGLSDLLSNVAGQVSSSGFDISSLINTFTGNNQPANTGNPQQSPGSGGGILNLIGNLFKK